MKRALVAASTAVGVAAFAYSVWTLGAANIRQTLGRIGWGFAVIVLLSGLRELARAVAWTRTLGTGEGLSIAEALRARLAGEALNTLLPMGFIVGEPAKAQHVANRLPFSTAFGALMTELAFYSASLALLFGVAALTVLPWAALLCAMAGAGILFLVLKRLPRLLEPVRRFAAQHPGRAWTILALEASYHALGIVEVYVTLLFISPLGAAWTSAVLFETVNRGVTIAFKMLPMRVGVDEASAALVSNRLALGSATGLMLALVRKLRLLFWAALGLALMVLRARPLSLGARMTAMSRISVAALLFVTLSVARAFAQSGAGVVSGTVSLPSPEGQPVSVPGVTVTLTCANSQPAVEVSDERGHFRFGEASIGDCSVAAELQGFKTAATTVLVKADQTTDISLRLELEALHEEVEVVGHTQAIESNPIATHVETMNAAVMQTAPIASERFQDALPLIPGVVRGPDGLLNVNGARSNQTALTFNDADGSDPVTGDEAIELPIDAVSSVEVRGAAFAPEFGMSAGAVTTVETQRGGQSWHVTLNDLEPRIRVRDGDLHGIESWTPRVTTGGPVVTGKVSLLESVQYEYSQTQVFDLPPLESDTKLESIESYTRADWTASIRNHFTASLLASPRKTTYAGLNPFNPQPVTPDVKNHNILATASDQIIVGNSGLLENRASVKQLDSTIYPSQGNGPMLLAPEVNSGSYFNSQDRTGRRIEWLTTYAFTPIGPEHLFKIGAGAAYESVDGVSLSRAFDVLRENGTASYVTTFAGSGLLDRHRTALRGFAQDAWTVSSRLTLLYGARYDYDSLTGDVNVAPRASVTALASEDGRTVIRSGIGIFYSPVPLNVATFDQLQERTVVHFLADGTTPDGPASVLPNVFASDLHTPRSLNWNVEMDREWIKNLFVRVGYQQRDTRNEPIVNASTTELTLETDGRSHYREGQVTGRYQFHGTDQVVASYTRSSAVGDLNDFNSYFGNIQNPIIEPNQRGPLPWDAPNRWLFWSSVSLPKGFAIFPVLDVRTGFPLSIVDADRHFVGPRDQAGRYPTFVSLDTQVTKRFRLFNHNATIGVKIFNITGHFNPRDYQGNLAAADFDHFYNSVGRTFRGKWIFEF